MEYKHYKHYTHKGFFPDIDADITIRKKYVSLIVWINHAGSSKVLFNRKCSNEAEAMEILKGFGHGYEYLGDYWKEVK